MDGVIDDLAGKSNPLPAWDSLLQEGFDEFICASCQFGSIHKKEFCFLVYLVDAGKMEVKCPGGHQHVRVEGKWTKASAVYTWELADHLAAGFERALKAISAAESAQPEVSGLESPVVNDILSASDWKQQEKCWSWKRRSHINVLEGHAGLATLTAASKGLRDTRFVGLLDSRVAKGALAKGRSASRALQAVCRRSLALQVAFGLYPGWCFAPTRLNVADDPTRRVRLRRKSDCSILTGCSDREVQALHATQLKRFAANWVRLVILLFSIQPAPAHDVQPPSTCCQTGTSPLPRPDVRQLWTWTFDWIFAVSHQVVLWIFTPRPDSSGLWFFEGRLEVAEWIPQHLSSVWILCVWFAVMCWVCVSVSVPKGAPSRFLWTLVVFLSAAFAMEPSSKLETERAQRRAGIDLVATRVVRKDTHQRRGLLLADFRSWLHSHHGIMLSVLLTAKPPDAEEICKYLVLYGQQMFAAGKAYGKFAETINAVASSRPAIKKQLTAAWDLCFAWLADEPTQHHPALPLAMLLAMMSLALLWGWPAEAAIFGMAWTGLLRIGEVLNACREDLVLPSDSMPGVKYALLKINTPKTRGRAARHQAARIDPPDIVALLEAVFGKANKSQPLWELSAATLRRRFSDILAALRLPTKKTRGKRPFDLSSLRPGGTTFHLLEHEDPERTRRRGRWVNSKVMDIYVQEVLYTTYTEHLTDDIRIRVHQLASSFDRILELAIMFLQTAVPPSTWLRLYQANDTEELGKMWGENGCKVSFCPNNTWAAGDGDPSHRR